MSSGELVGRVLGDFRVLGLLEEGGMGLAFHAEQVTLHREAVVKTIAAETVSEEAKVRFLREARLASRLDHPYAAHVYAFGAEPDGVLWIAMELVRGMPLDRMLADQGAMPLARFVPLFDRLCEVVYSAHEQGIIHRDIKPGNVMVVRRAGRLLPKLLDLGIARGTDQEETAPILANLDDLADTPSPRGTPDITLDGGKSVTIRGRVVGSPEYMAPEQWVHATAATARTDQYALAVTAYEMLTGRRPFTAPTVLAVARAHARKEAPPVGPNLPAALDRVFARALAKKPDDRYASVLELAAALREVARDTGPSVVADLDEALRDTFVQNGPQPLAEALLELAAARTPEEARDGAWRVTGTLVRTLAVIALAARTRVGSRDDAAGAHVRKLVEQGLDITGWCELLAATVEPFAAQPQGHPVPELVEAIARKPFAKLLALRAADAVDAEHVRGLLRELAQVLRACGFLTDYTWASGGEVWMGPRRQPRERRTAPAGVWLLDKDGAAVLELSPLARVAPPSPGADDELFLVDGPAKRGARAVAWPKEFERFDEELAKFVAEHLAQLRARSAGEATEVTPYRGLASFGPGDAAMFFGRELEVEAVVNRMRVEPVIAVVGPSGVGKSSFVHAGVLPSLPEGWQTMSMRPGASPLTAVESRLAAAGLISLGGLADTLRSDPTRLAKVLDDAAQRQGAPIVLVIDQLEEMFTQCRDAAVREQFARALAAIGGNRVHVIFTLRDDFLVRAAELPDLGRRIQIALELVTLPNQDALRRILVEPLRRVGFTFESDAMPDEMVAAVRENAGALALLSFAASKLWDLRDNKLHHIPRRAYDAIGGVAGALARHAEDTLLALPERDHPLVRELFRHLVTSEGTRALLLRSEAIQLLGKGAAAERVIEALVERRLIVGYEGDAKGERIEVIHEALLSAWPRLVTWQREDAEFARLRDSVRSAARQWGERGRPKGLLWRGKALLELELWRERAGVALTDLEHEFATASLAEERRAKRLRAGALAIVIAGLVIGLVILQRANAAAEKNAEETRRANVAMLVENGRAQLVDDHPQEAMVYLAEAYAQSADDRNLSLMLGIASSRLAGEQFVLPDHAGGAKWARFTPDDRQLVTADAAGKVRVWDGHTGALVREMTTAGADRFSTPSLTADGGVVVWAFRAPPEVWDLATGRKRFELAVPPGTRAVAAPGTDVIVTTDDKGIHTWNASDGKPRADLAVAVTPDSMTAFDHDRYAVGLEHGTAVGSLDLAAPPRIVASGQDIVEIHGDRLARVQFDGPGLWVWNLAEADPQPHALTGHPGNVVAATFSPDGKRLASLSMDHTARLWDVDSGHTIATLTGHSGYVSHSAWSDDGKLLATAGIDRTVRVWDAFNGAPREVFFGHGDLILDVAFDHSGTRVASASADGTVRVFAIHDRGRDLDLRHMGPVSLRISADGRRLLAVAQDGTAWVVDAATRTTIATFDHWPQQVFAPNEIVLARMRTCGDLDATGATIAIPTGDKVRVIPVADPGHPQLELDAKGVRCVRFGPGGRIFAGLRTGSVVVWSATGAQEREIKIAKRAINELDVDAAGRIAAASDDGSASLVEVDGRVRTLVNGLPWVAAIALSPTRVAAGSEDAVVRLFDPGSLAQVAGPHTTSDIEGLAFSVDGHLLAASTIEGEVTVFDGVDGREMEHLKDPTLGWLTGVAISPDGRWLVGANDRGVLRWESLSRETRPPQQVSEDARCHIPYELRDAHLIAHKLTTCAAM